MNKSSEKLSEIIKKRHSTRVLFNPNKKVSKENLNKIIEAARWAPTAHNMQNFEIIVIDDKTVLNKLYKIESTISEEFIRENFQQLSNSEDELKKRKVGILGTQFPLQWRDASKLDDAIKAIRPSSLSYTIKDSPSVLIILYDSRKRAPASKGDVLGFLSLGCVMQNMWLMSESLNIDFQIMSAFSGQTISNNIKQVLNIPKYMEIAFAIRLGYAVTQNKYLRVRRDIKDFTHYNIYVE